MDIESATNASSSPDLGHCVVSKWSRKDQVLLTQFQQAQKLEQRAGDDFLHRVFSVDRT